MVLHRHQVMGIDSQDSLQNIFPYLAGAYKSSPGLFSCELGSRMLTDSGESLDTGM